MLPKPLVAALVALLPVRGVMRQSVHLQREPRGGAVEIENVEADRVLPAKAQATGLPFPQCAPKQDLRQRHCSAELAGAVDGQLRCSHAPSTMLLMVPLPRFAGEGR